MRYGKTVRGKFIERPNRFIARVEIEGKIETVHVKNTGRCRELLLPGSTVIMEDFRNRPEAEGRKTKFDLIAVYKKTDRGDLLINMDSQLPNKVAEEWLSSLPEGQKYDYIKPEYTYGKSRVDFYMEQKVTGGIQKYLMEVKGCTLERNGTGFFPDAPTERGIKHLHELAAAAGLGYRCFLAFVIQVPGVTRVFPNTETHREFAVALEQAEAAGVEVLYLQCDVKEDEVTITRRT